MNKITIQLRVIIYGPIDPKKIDQAHYDIFVIDKYSAIIMIFSIYNKCLPSYIKAIFERGWENENDCKACRCLAEESTPKIFLCVTIKQWLILRKN